MLTRRDYQNALDAQTACNLSGIVRSLAEVTDRIWAEARAAGGGTEFVNRHPISRLYAEQIAFLTGAAGGYDAYHEASEACREGALAEEFDEAELGCPVG